MLLNRRFTIGYTALMMKRAAYTPQELKQVGYQAAELKVVLFFINNFHGHIPILISLTISSRVAKLNYLELLGLLCMN